MGKAERRLMKQEKREQVKQQIKVLQLQLRKALANGQAGLKDVADITDRIKTLRGEL
mgnify:CR=1 FL=1